jgi:hypothetical protein
VDVWNSDLSYERDVRYVARGVGCGYKQELRRALGQGLRLPVSGPSSVALSEGSSRFLLLPTAYAVGYVSVASFGAWRLNVLRVRAKS